ncbi:type IV toxin-antitoxin system AbiEi family antitoxin domain-containing protein [Mycolicibacterium goodii]|uniref:Type IV toxin-antitoxin system AbiEi family antitoxin domain-containing protein n=1 Tax=Mycolicibacterium goodii TaxID=134601 RepID=A0ABS6HRW6_MYCGD|nr:type IV toxin-antitoxin system AbiEi family antitoxin domain-containing protein [Mycolicibacterium goodii]MBU8824285.1 type IV toxin-antitoxin system AbiEi family antitoxin domain-containing protein [Mycolicibacterium goodii]MBU8837931.1 type IV toxin-antitoxin system AbiEi family antitoxin domain-containing protein [Mycolicibacterium goodii]
MPLDEIFAVNGGVATTAQLTAVMTRKVLASLVRSGAIKRVCRGVYCLHTPGSTERLAALDLLNTTPIVACMSTAAAFYGFDTENDNRVHILDPGVRIRSDSNLVVHQRVGAHLRRVCGRLATAPAWTAVEIARTLRRPRALATLDAALHVGACTADELAAAVREQKGRRGIVAVRDLLPHADGRAESPMESEMRLVFLDRGVPDAELQYEIVDHTGKLWRVDFAWPDAKVAAEYDSMQWHANPTAFTHDRIKVARLQECGWTTIAAVADDIRKHPEDLVRHLRRYLDRPARPAIAG